MNCFLRSKKPRVSVSFPICLSLQSLLCICMIAGLFDKDNDSLKMYVIIVYYVPFLSSLSRTCLELDRAGLRQFVHNVPFAFRLIFVFIWEGAAHFLKTQ